MASELASEVKAMEIRMRRGQALVESFVFLIVMSLFFIGIPFIGKLANDKQALQNESRYMAFQYAIRLGEGAKSIYDSSYSNIKKLTSNAQPGQDLAKSEILRNEWQIDDKGIINSISQKKVADKAKRKFLISSLVLEEEAKLIFDTEYEINAKLAHNRSSQSHTAWKKENSKTQKLAKKSNSLLSPVDKPLKRTLPGFDSYKEWIGDIPSNHKKGLLNVFN